MKSWLNQKQFMYLLGNKQDKRNQRIVPCVLLHLWAELRRQSKKEKKGKAQISEYRYNIVFATKGTYHDRTRPFAAHRVTPTYLRSQKDVPTRWWGRHYSRGEELPPERQQLSWCGFVARLVAQEAGVIMTWRIL